MKKVRITGIVFERDAEERHYKDGVRHYFYPRDGGGYHVSLRGPEETGCEEHIGPIPNETVIYA